MIFIEENYLKKWKKAGVGEQHLCKVRVFTCYFLFIPVYRKETIISSNI